MYTIKNLGQGRKTFRNLARLICIGLLVALAAVLAFWIGVVLSYYTITGQFDDATLNSAFEHSFTWLMIYALGSVFMLILVAASRLIVTKGDWLEFLYEKLTTRQNGDATETFEGPFIIKSAAGTFGITHDSIQRTDKNFKKIKRYQLKYLVKELTEPTGLPFIVMSREVADGVVRPLVRQELVAA